MFINYLIIAKSRAFILDEIQSRNQTTSLRQHLELINLKYSKGLLNPELSEAIKTAWLKPRAHVLTSSTITKWMINRNRRGHDSPIKKSKDYTTYPWHELVFKLRQKYPTESYVKLHCRLNLKYPGISYARLIKLVNFVRKELGDNSL
jgi:hypothetical protein